MTDFHSHILPCMDDGSKSVEESLKMLKMLSEQGVDRVVATPHFYANNESLDRFLERRQKSFEMLSERLYDGLPEVVLGAEVRFYEGISRMGNLDALCMQNSDLLLLEMPFGVWTQSAQRQLIDISCSGRVTLALAHIERYSALQSMAKIESLLGNDIIMQINASFVTNLMTRAKAIKLLKKGYIHLIGSDCHNLTDRAPNIGAALDIISKKISGDFIEYIDDYADSLFEQNR